MTAKEFMDVMKKEAETFFSKMDEMIEKIPEDSVEPSQEKWPLKDLQSTKDSKYFFVKDNGDITWGYWENDVVDEWRLANNNVFKTEEDAKKYRDIFIKLNEIIDELGRPSFEDWQYINIKKYFLYYDFTEKEFSCGANVSFLNASFSFYCLKYYKQKAIEEIGEDNLIWFFTYHIKNIVR